MHKVRVGILRGGPGHEYEISLKTGGAALSHIPTEKYETHDIFVDREGVWHRRGLPTTPNQVLPTLDVIFNAMHGEYGEDGRVQALLSHYRIPYTGSRAIESALCINKAHTKEALGNTGIKIPEHRILEASLDIRGQIDDVFRSLPQPFIVKPIASGSSVGVQKVETLEELTNAAKEIFTFSPKVLVEEYIEGQEATCGIVDGLRGETHYALLPVEITPHKEHTFFDYAAKYEGKSDERCPGNFSREESQELQRLARLVHQKLNLRHYSRSDFILAGDGIYFLEVNTLPGLTAESLIPKSLNAIGVELPQFFDHVLSLAIAGK